MDALDRFGAEAALLGKWARYGADRGELAAREGLLRITRLFLAALELPPAWSEELTVARDAMAVADEEWRSVCGR